MNRAVAVLTLSLVIGISACTDSEKASAPPTTTVTAAVPATGVISSDDPRAAQIVAIVEKAIVEQDLQSVAFAVWDGDEEVVRGAIDKPSVQPATAIDAKFRVGQPMEAMLGTVALQLATEGKLDLDAPVAKYVPDLVNADRITPRMLANSIGGTPDYVPDEAFSARVAANPFVGYTFEELLGYAQRTPPLFEPGTSWAYSHTEIAALIEVLEAASGQSLEDLMATRIFEPLAMTDSSAHQNNDIDPPLFQAFTNQRGVYENSTHWDPTWGINGGMNATTADLGRWMRALSTGELLNEADAKESLAPVTAGLGPMTGQVYFAYGSIVKDGWVLGNPSLNGYQGFVAQQRDPSLTIVVWATAGPTNTEQANGAQAISTQIGGLMSETPFTL